MDKTNDNSDELFNKVLNKELVDIIINTSERKKKENRQQQTIYRKKHKKKLYIKRKKLYIKRKKLSKQPKILGQRGWMMPKIIKTKKNNGESIMKRFVIGDIHGRIEALKEVLQLSNFDYYKDMLIVLGDVVDGGFDSFAVVEELMKIINLRFVIGNHDEWFINYIEKDWYEEIWLQQGGANTLRSYGAEVIEGKNVSEESMIDKTNLFIPNTHKYFFRNGMYYFIFDDMLFVHGGINPKLPIHKQTKQTLLWDRLIINYAHRWTISGYDKVFIGHTTTQNFGKIVQIKDCLAPIKYNNLIMMDCGAGWNGKLAIMDINTEKYWVSEIQKPAIK